MVESNEIKVQETLPSVEEKAKEAQDIFSKASLVEKQAAVYLYQIIERRRQLLYNASAGVLRRIATALDSDPFGDEFTPKMGDEKELFELGREIVNTKTFLLSKELGRKAEEQAKQQTTIKEAENGKLDQSGISEKQEST